MHGIKIKIGGLGEVIDTKEQWGIVCKEFPFKLYGDVKDFPSNNWADEDGKDVYYPVGSKFEAYSIEVEFAAKGYASDTTNLRKKIGAFVKYLMGRDTPEGSTTNLSIYDPYTGVGRRGIYLSKINNDVYVKQTVNGNQTEEVCEFKLTFNVCDPATDITL